MSPGVHPKKNGEGMTMSLRLRGKASTATAPNMSPGVHPKKNGEGMTTSTRLRGEASHATTPNMSPGVHPKKNGEGMTMSTRLRMQKLNTEYGRKRNLVRPMNGTAHLNPNAENDFITNCAAAKELFRKVSFHLSKLPLNQFY